MKVKKINNKECIDLLNLYKLDLKVDIVYVAYLDDNQIGFIGLKYIYNTKFYNTLNITGKEYYKDFVETTSFVLEKYRNQGVKGLIFAEVCKAFYGFISFVNIDNIPSTNWCLKNKFEFLRNSKTNQNIKLYVRNLWRNR